MFRKISFRVLLYILGVLTLLSIITQISQRKSGERTFRSELASFDTSKVTSVTIADFKDRSKTIELTRSGRIWKMNANGKEYPTDPEYINSFIWELTQLKAERIAANRKDKWKEFEVTDSLALRVTVKEKSNILADLRMGKFSLQPQQGNPYNQQPKMTSFVRVGDEKEVYAVNGFIRGNFSPDVNRFRDKTIFKAMPGSLKKLKFQYPADSSFNLEKQGNSWTINGTPADSAKTARYLSSLKNKSGMDFADDAIITGQPVFKLSAEYTNSMQAEIMAYVSDSTNGYVITSSLNPGVQFSGKSGLAESIFKGRSSFLK